MIAFFIPVDTVQKIVSQKEMKMPITDGDFP